MTVLVAGEVAPDAITSLGNVGGSRIVATDINQAAAADQCRLIRVARPDGSEHVVGTVDEAGNLAVQPRASRDTSAVQFTNIRAYGGRGDGRTFDDGVTTAADATFTSATAAFTAADIGKSIVILGAGSDGAALATTIDSVTNATTVELDDVAVKAVTNAPTLVGTDNEGAISDAIAAIAATGGTLFFPASSGSYVVGTALTIPAHVEVRFEEGALLAPAGVTVAIEGRVSCHPNQHVFMSRGFGTIVIAGRSFEQVSVMHWGAIPSEVDSATPFDCTDAFLAAIAAATGANSATARHSVVVIPRCDTGFEYFLAGKELDSFRGRHVEISRTVKILGVGTGDSVQGGSRIKLGPLCAGFRLVPLEGSSDGGDASGTWIEGLSIMCTPMFEEWMPDTEYAPGAIVVPRSPNPTTNQRAFQTDGGTSDDDLNEPAWPNSGTVGDNGMTWTAIDGFSTLGVAIDRGWHSDHAYTKGHLIRPHRFHNLYYECLKDGTSGGPTPAIGDCSRYATKEIPVQGNRWMPGREYLENDTVYPNTPCGRLFICTDPGTTIGQLHAGGTPQDGEPTSELVQAEGQQPNVGEPEWIEGLEDPRARVYPAIEELAPQVGGQGPKWAPLEDPKTITGATNASPIVITTLAAHGYANGAVVIIRGVRGNEAANGVRRVANVTTMTFELQNLFGRDVAGSGPYTSDGQSVEASDPEPLWEDDNLGTVCHASSYKPEHLYRYGAHVFGKDGGGNERYDVIFLCVPDGGTTGTSDAAQPADFETALPGDPGIADNDITWYPIEPFGVVPDGTTFWAARFAGAYLVQAPSCTIARPLVEHAPTAAIGIFSFALKIPIPPDGAVLQSLFADFTRVRGPGGLYQNAVGIYARGSDANAGAISDLVIVSEGADFWRDPAAHAVYDYGFHANHYVNCIVQGCSGYAFAMLSPSGHGSLVNSYAEGVGRKSPLRGTSQVLGGAIDSNVFKLNQVDANSHSPGGPSVFSDQVSNLRAYAHSHNKPGMTITTALKGSRDGAFFFKAENDLAPGTGDDRDGYQFTYGIVDGWWTFLHNFLDAFHVSGENAEVGRAVFWLQRGHYLGNADKHYHFADDGASRDSFITESKRRKGDIVDRPDNAVVGRYYHHVKVNSGEGKYGFPWENNKTYPPGAIVVPTRGKVTPSRRAFFTELGGLSGANPEDEPNWPDGIDDPADDNEVDWVAIEGADFRYASLIEDGIVGRRIQPVLVWRDTEDTDPRVAQENVRVRTRRFEASTPDDAADQTIDDGLEVGTDPDAEDFSLAPDAVAFIDAVLLFKEPGTTNAGSIRLRGAFCRDSAGGPPNDVVECSQDAPIVNVDPLGPLATTTAALVAVGAAVEIHVSPGADVVLEWRVVRTQTEGDAPL